MATMKLDIGGAETHIVELSKALKRRGIEVYVASNGGAYEKELNEAGITHFKVSLHSKRPFHMRRAYNALERIIVENKIDIVHAHARIPGFLCGLLKKKYKFKFVTTAHWVFNTRFPLNLLTNWGDRSLAVSDDIKDYLIKNYNCKPDRIRITINGIDTEKFIPGIDYSDIAKEFDLKADKTRVVYVSRMDEDRSLAAHKLIEITEELNKTISNLEVVIVGGGNDFQNIKAKADDVNGRIGHRVIITTNSRTDINKFIASGKIFVGVSRAALEAMACEKPSIIAGNEGYIGIFDESKLKAGIDTNFCCRGFEETTCEKLKKDILTLILDENSLCERLGKYSRGIVKKYYSLETMADDAIKMYVSIIKDSDINSAQVSEIKDIDEYIHPFDNKRNIDVMISGYYGFKNSGDDSILSAIVDSLRNLSPNIRISVLSKNPKDTRRVYSVSAINRFNFIRIWRNLRHTKLLISGGGSLIQDVTSNQSLMYYLGIIKAAQRRGCKVMLYANGIGPVTNVSNHKYIKNVLNMADIITLREYSSLEELNKLEVTGPKVMVTADPAFTLKDADYDETLYMLEGSGIKKHERYFVIAIRDWKTAKTKFEGQIAGFAKYINAKYKIRPLFVPMQTNFDVAISKRVIRRIEDDCAIVDDLHSPSQILGIVRNAEFVLGMRLHILIYAASVGTPVIGLVYDPKVKAMMDYMGQEYVVNVENANFDILKEYADSILQNKDKISERLKQISLESNEKALENARLALKLIQEN